MKKFGVGLVSYKMKKDDIESLSNSFGNLNPSYKVVVDNSPTDESKFYFEKFDWTYIHNSNNPGFGVSHNFIFKKYSSCADYHLIVNPDIIFRSNVIGELINFLESRVDAGCVMPKILYPNGTIQRLAKLLPSPQDLFFRRFPFVFFKKKINSIFELQLADYDSGTFRVPFVSGCFLLFKSKVIDSIGFFDERYFMYAEDIDLSRRLWLNETFPYYFGNVFVFHRYEKGSSKNVQLFFIHVFSIFKYFNKWGWFDKHRIKINKECLDQF